MKNKLIFQVGFVDRVYRIIMELKQIQALLQKNRLVQLPRMEIHSLQTAEPVVEMKDLNFKEILIENEQGLQVNEKKQRKPPNPDQNFIKAEITRIEDLKKHFCNKLAAPSSQPEVTILLSEQDLKRIEKEHKNLRSFAQLEQETDFLLFLSNRKQRVQERLVEKQDELKFEAWFEYLDTAWASNHDYQDFISLVKPALLNSVTFKECCGLFSIKTVIGTKGHLGDIDWKLVEDQAESFELRFAGVNQPVDAQRVNFFINKVGRKPALEGAQAHLFRNIPNQMWEQLIGSFKHGSRVCPIEIKFQ